MDHFYGNPETPTFQKVPAGEVLPTRSTRSCTFAGIDTDCTLSVKISIDARYSLYLTWKCGGLCSSKYIVITIPRNRQISGILQTSLFHKSDNPPAHQPGFSEQFSIGASITSLIDSRIPGIDSRYSVSESRSSPLWKSGCHSTASQVCATPPPHPATGTNSHVLR